MCNQFMQTQKSQSEIDWLFYKINILILFYITHSVMLLELLDSEYEYHHLKD